MTKHPRAEAGGAKLSLRLIGRFVSYTVSQPDISQALLQPLTEQPAEDCRSSRPDSRHSTHLQFLDTPHSRVSFVPGSQQECWLRYRSPVKKARELITTTENPSQSDRYSVI